MVLPDVRPCRQPPELREIALVPISRDMNRRALAGIALGVAIVTAGACASSGVRAASRSPRRPTAPEPAPEPTPPCDAARRRHRRLHDCRPRRCSCRASPIGNGGTRPVPASIAAGFMQYVFAQYGVALPRDVRDQYRVGRSDRRSTTRARRPASSSRRTAPGASHVGIAIGGDQFVHAPSSTRRRPRGELRLRVLGEHIAGAPANQRRLAARHARQA